MPDKTPKYAYLVNWIKQEIKGNQLVAGERFYSETELAEKFQMSRQTVRQAVGILEQAGYLERRRGSGTYVSYGGPSSKRELTKTTQLRNLRMATHTIRAKRARVVEEPVDPHPGRPRGGQAGLVGGVGQEGRVDGSAAGGEQGARVQRVAPVVARTHQ